MTPRIVSVEEVRGDVSRASWGEAWTEDLAHTVLVLHEQIDHLVNELAQTTLEGEQEIEELHRLTDDQAQRLQAVRSLCTASAADGIPLAHRRIYEVTLGGYAAGQVSLPPTVDEFRARVLVILSESIGHPLSIGHAARLITEAYARTLGVES